MADILIVNGVVITIDGERRIIENGAVAITGDRIVDIGTTADLTTRHEAGRIIDAAGMAVMPGLIDGHAHAGHGLIKTLGGGRSDLWYKACELAYTVGSTEAFWYAEARLAALERLRFGVTTGVSLLGGGDSIMRTDDPDYGDAHCRGVVEVGTRSVVAIGPTRPPHPRTYARWHGNEKTEFPVDFARQMQTCETLIERWHGSHGRRIGIALLTPTLRKEHVTELGEANLEEAKRQAMETRRLSRERGVIFTQDGHTTGSVAFAHELGLLGPDALLSHSTNLNPEEIAICGETGTCIAHNPSAIASVLGRCPAPELIEAGATVCLGSDATAPDRSADMFRHMQQCMHYHRTFFHDPSWLPPGRVLEMCTVDGAKALGMADDIGSLEVGKKADVILVDLRRPHLYPANMPAFRVVYFANGNDVHTVIVDGKVVLEDRKATQVDEDAILDQAQEQTEIMLDRLDLRHLTAMPDTFWKHVRATDQLR
jgi:cytosine/adenosine deaminase-related metal-dependent hydrolase